MKAKQVLESMTKLEYLESAIRLRVRALKPKLEAYPSRSNEHELVVSLHLLVKSVMAETGVRTKAVSINKEIQNFVDTHFWRTSFTDLEDTVTEAIMSLFTPDIS